MLVYIAFSLSTYEPCGRQTRRERTQESRSAMTTDHGPRYFPHPRQQVSAFIWQLIGIDGNSRSILTFLYRRRG